jgi:hypothetical protein
MEAHNKQIKIFQPLSDNCNYFLMFDTTGKDKEEIQIGKRGHRAERHVISQPQ